MHHGKWQEHDALLHHGVASVIIKCAKSPAHSNCSSRWIQFPCCRIEKLQDGPELRILGNIVSPSTQERVLFWGRKIDFGRQYEKTEDWSQEIIIYFNCSLFILYKVISVNRCTCNISGNMASVQTVQKQKVLKVKAVYQKRKLFRANEPLLSVFMWGINHTVRWIFRWLELQLCECLEVPIMSLT